MYISKYNPGISSFYFALKSVLYDFYRYYCRYYEFGIFAITEWYKRVIFTNIIIDITRECSMYLLHKSLSFYFISMSRTEMVTAR